MDISTNRDAVDNVPVTGISLHHNDIKIVPENEKSVVKQKCVNLEEPQKFMDEMKTAIQCWAGMKVTRYRLFKTRALLSTRICSYFILSINICLIGYKFIAYKTFY